MHMTIYGSRVIQIVHSDNSVELQRRRGETHENVHSYELAINLLRVPCLGSHGQQIIWKMDHPCGYHSALWYLDRPEVAVI